MTNPCLVLDIDDTLYLERDYVRSGFAHVGRWVAVTLGIPDFFEHAWRAFEEGRRGDIFDLCLANAGMDPSGVSAQIVALYRSHEPEIHLAADASRFLERVSGRRLAVITDGPLASQRAKARALGLSRWFNPIVFTAEHGPGFPKPSPLPFQFVADAFDASGGDCWYFADNPHKDFQGPKSLGWHTVRVRRSGGLHFDVPGSSDIDMEVESFDGFHEFK